MPLSAHLLEELKKVIKNHPPKEIFEIPILLGKIHEFEGRAVDESANAAQISELIREIASSSLTRLKCAFPLPHECQIALADALKNHRFLIEVDLGSSNIEPALIADILEHNNIIQKLILTSNWGDTRELSLQEAKNIATGLENNKALKVLDLSKNSLDNDCLEIILDALKGNTTLEQLNLFSVISMMSYRNSKILEDFLASNSGLKQFTIGNEAINLNNLAAALKKNKSLQTLELPSARKSNLRGKPNDNTDLDSLATGIVQNGGVRHLDLSSNYIDENGIEHLVRILNETKLRTLNLCNNAIYAQGAVRLANALKGNTNVYSLNLYGSSITTAGAIAFAQVLKNNLFLIHVNLGYNLIGREAADEFALALESHLLLKTLCLDSNGLSDEGVAIIANALVKNKTLESISLKSNNAKRKSASAFAKVLRNNQSLKILDLGSNGIDDNGVTELASALADNTTLTTLILRNNPFGERGLKALTDMLRVNETLTTIILDGNHNIVPKETFIAFIDALKQNSSITTVHLPGVLVAEEMVMILELLEINSTITEVYFTNHSDINPDIINQIEERLLENRELEKTFSTAFCDADRAPVPSSPYILQKAPPKNSGLSSPDIKSFTLMPS